VGEDFDNGLRRDRASEWQPAELGKDFCAVDVLIGQWLAEGAQARNMDHEFGKLRDGWFVRGGSLERFPSRAIRFDQQGGVVFSTVRAQPGQNKVVDWLGSVSFDFARDQGDTIRWKLKFIRTDGDDVPVCQRDLPHAKMTGGCHDDRTSTCQFACQLEDGGGFAA
jgi:hypothetical protein